MARVPENLGDLRNFGAGGGGNMAISPNNIFGALATMMGGPRPTGQTFQMRQTGIAEAKNGVVFIMNANLREDTIPSDTTEEKRKAQSVTVPVEAIALSEGMTVQNAFDHKFTTDAILVWCTSKSIARAVLVEKGYEITVIPVGKGKFFRRIFGSIPWLAEESDQEQFTVILEAWIADKGLARVLPPKSLEDENKDLQTKIEDREKTIGKFGGLVEEQGKQMLAMAAEIRKLKIALQKHGRKKKTKQSKEAMQVEEVEVVEGTGGEEVLVSDDSDLDEEMVNMENGTAESVRSRSPMVERKVTRHMAKKLEETNGI